MVLTMSASTLTNSGCNGLRVSNQLLGRHSGPAKRSDTNFGVERSCLWYLGSQSVSFTWKQSDASRGQGFRLGAQWPFKGGDQSLGASSEQSESANEDILIFFFQLDLSVQVQRALNLEEYEIAQQLRNKLSVVETEAIRQQEGKRGSSSKSEAQDIAINLLRLRAELQDAIQSENYDTAAQLRDKISKLEAKSLTASAKAQLYEIAQYAFRLGQKLRHKKYGYRAVVCGMDPVCCESNSWKENANVDELSRGPDQPFYQVLVDVYYKPDILVAYVPEENLLAPDQPDLARFDHPYISFLFYGMDGAGDFIPIKQLREKFDRPRHELPYDPPEENGGDS